MDGTVASTSFSTVSTVVGATNVSAISASDPPRGRKSKTEEDYKVVPDPAFPHLQRDMKTSNQRVKGQEPPQVDHTMLRS